MDFLEALQLFDSEQRVTDLKTQLSSEFLLKSASYLCHLFLSFAIFYCLK